MLTDWLMVIITAIYVIATIFICIYNGKSANAAKTQTEEIRRQFYAINRPLLSVEIVYLRKAFFALRFTNNGNQTAFNTFFDISEDNKEDNKDNENLDVLLKEPEKDFNNLLENTNVDLLEDLDDSIIANDRIKKLLDDLNNQGIKTTYDYFEFNDSYQYIIKIDKNKKD